MSFYVTQGDIEESLSILREAAQWLIDTGRPMWKLEELTRERLAGPPESFLVLYETGTPHTGAATALLSFHDPLFWPDVPPGTSGFLHKLAVRRAYAGKDCSLRLIRHAAALCLRKNIHSLRLDCDPHRPGLCALYERAGFVLAKRQTKTLPPYGTVDLALYKMGL